MECLTVKVHLRKQAGLRRDLVREHCGGGSFEQSFFNKITIQTLKRQKEPYDTSP